MSISLTKTLDIIVSLLYNAACYAEEANKHFHNLFPVE